MRNISFRPCNANSTKQVGICSSSHGKHVALSIQFKYNLIAPELLRATDISGFPQVVLCSILKEEVIILTPVATEHGIRYLVNKSMLFSISVEALFFSSHRNGECTALMEGFVRFLEHLNKFKRTSSYSRRSWVSALYLYKLASCLTYILHSQSIFFNGFSL